MRAICGDYMPEMIPPKLRVIKVVGVSQRGLLEVDYGRLNPILVTAGKKFPYSVINADIEVYSHHLDVSWSILSLPKAQKLLSTIMHFLNRFALNPPGESKLGDDWSRIRP